MNKGADILIRAHFPADFNVSGKVFWGCIYRSAVLWYNESA